MHACPFIPTRIACSHPPPPPACTQAQKAAAASAAKAQEKERERQAKLAAQQDRAQQQRMGDVMKNVFGTSGANKPKIKIKVSNPGAAGGRPPPAATRSGAAKGGGGGMGAPMPQQDAWLDDALGAQGMPFGDSDEDLDLGDLNSDDSLYMPSPQHPTQPGASKGACAHEGGQAVCLCPRLWACRRLLKGCQQPVTCMRVADSSLVYFFFGGYGLCLCF